MKRIFFVEDDLSLINGLSFALKKQGYEIDVARTSLEADSGLGRGSTFTVNFLIPTKL